MDEFIKNMPKIDLHAHLNGSLTEETLLELAVMKYGQASEDFKNLCSKIKVKSTGCSLSECFEIFKIAHELTSTKDCLQRATMCAIRDFVADSVVYLELRTTPKETEFMSKFEYLESVLNAINSWTHSSNSNITVKLLPSIDRSRGLEEAKSTLECVRTLMKLYPNIIVGIDLSGNPEGNSFHDYKDILKEARNSGLKLALHCGEIKNDKEIFDMLEFGMDRCGHGTFINGENFKLLKQKRIPLECCLTSNVKCQTVLSYNDHHFKELYESRHPVVICTDDFAVFDTTLSKELQIACATFNLSKNDLFVLTQNAISSSFSAEEPEKKSLTRIITEYFNLKK